MDAATAKRRRFRVLIGCLVLFFIFCGGSPFPELLVWRWKVNQQLGNTESEVLQRLGKPSKVLKKGDPPSAFVHYPPLRSHPPEPRVLVYGFMNVRALLYVSPNEKVSRIELLDLKSQVEDNEVRP